MKNKVMIILNTISYLIIIFLTIICIFTTIKKINKKDVSIFGYQVYCVVSPSMEPKYKVNDVLIVKQDTAIKLKDDIVYLGKEGNLAGKRIVHQVIKIEENNTVTIYQTKGIANLSADPKIEEEQIIGKVVYKTFIFSLIFKIIQEPIGFISIIIVPLVLLLVSQIISIKKEGKINKKIVK